MCYIRCTEVIEYIQIIEPRSSAKEESAYYTSHMVAMTRVVTEAHRDGGGEGNRPCWEAYPTIGGNI